MLLNCCCCYCDDTNNESRDQAARTNWTEDVTLYYPLSTFRREGFAKLENEAAASQPACLPPYGCIILSLCAKVVADVWPSAVPQST